MLEGDSIRGMRQKTLFAESARAESPLGRGRGPGSPFAVPGVRLGDKPPALHTDRGTRLCSASSATGSAEQCGLRKVPRGLFAYFLVREKV